MFACLIVVEIEISSSDGSFHLQAINFQRLSSQFLCPLFPYAVAGQASLAMDTRDMRLAAFPVPMIAADLR